MVDLLVRPVRLDQPLGAGRLFEVKPIEVTTGGIVSNSGIAMLRLGLNVAAFTHVGDDEWASVVESRYSEEGLDTEHVVRRSNAATSTTAVLVDPDGEHCFAHCGGAWKEMGREDYLAKLDFFAQVKTVLIGYYSLMPRLEKDLPEVLSALQKVGCRTALDTAGDGGRLQPLDSALPYLDVYVPSYAEAATQTGESDPQKMIECYRAYGANGLLGVKLGAEGALLSPEPGTTLKIDPVQPPGPLLDTTGAGDSFFAGLLTGLHHGLGAEEAGRLAAAAGACCVTGLGASAGLRTYEETARLAGIL